MIRNYDKLIFELSKEGRVGYSLPKNELKDRYCICNLPDNLKRESKPCLPQVTEFDVVRHYTNLSNKNFGVDTGFYPLGSCTMKYNPRLNEEIAALPAFATLHPEAPVEAAQGALEVYYNLAASLAEISGLSAFTLNPYAGAHGELTGLMIMRSYHLQRGDVKRTKVIVPDSAHGTNPASAAVCGLEIVEVKSTANGTVDVEDLKPLLDDTIAGIMMTNPNTLGIFETEIPEIARLVHECGGLLYYDGANLNAVLGKCRPGDMGFDIMHINLHKTFSTPHGGGGPGDGPVGVRAGLEHLLPNPQVKKNADGRYYIENDAVRRDDRGHARGAEDRHPH
ncbi:MAG: aminomethyl-transferring glycine dehydrogenase subunit GcvPB, partial [Bacteroidaceae bacterium]|nr:aminomethyl-transferring glycine dehydrogenase subunit GcvPB [Bacteroidaceae bacterium]